jgi:hypothetical protein
MRIRPTRSMKMLVSTMAVRPSQTAPPPALGCLPALACSSGTPWVAFQHQSVADRHSHNRGACGRAPALKASTDNHDRPVLNSVPCRCPGQDPEAPVLHPRGLLRELGHPAGGDAACRGRDRRGEPCLPRLPGHLSQPVLGLLGWALGLQGVPREDGRPEQVLHVQDACRLYEDDVHALPRGYYRHSTRLLRSVRTRHQHPPGQ